MFDPSSIDPTHPTTYLSSLSIGIMGAVLFSAFVGVGVLAIELIGAIWYWREIKKIDKLFPSSRKGERYGNYRS